MTIYFSNSYNQEAVLHKFNVKRRRDLHCVVMEVLEVLGRIYNNYSPSLAYVSPQLVCAELRENLDSVKEVFDIIEKHIGVIKSTQIGVVNKNSTNARLLKTKKLYTIVRHPTDDDYSKVYSDA